jgi:hypothetical protein
MSAMYDSLLDWFKVKVSILAFDIMNFIKLKYFSLVFIVQPMTQYYLLFPKLLLYFLFSAPLRGIEDIYIELSLIDLRLKYIYTLLEI